MPHRDPIVLRSAQLALWALTASAAIAQSPPPPTQPPQQNNAGCGGVYRTVDLLAATGNRAVYGCADLGGLTWVSARDPHGGGAHVLAAIDATGAVAQTVPQPAIHAASAFGMRDLCTDGTHLAGGSEAGISILTTSGALATSWHGQPISQPIAGPLLAAIGVPRGLAWDPLAAGGAGRFYAVNFDSPIYEFDLQGNITASWPNQGWSGTGLAIDPRSGNAWIDALPARGDLAELDRKGGTWQPTGRTIPRARPGGYGGGLSAAAGVAGQHAPWPAEVLLTGVDQGDPDLLAVYRLHLEPGEAGPDELRLETGANALPLDPAMTEIGELDTMTLRVADPTGARTGAPSWVLFNFGPGAASDDLTDLSALLPGVVALPEHRTRNSASVTHPSAGAAIVPLGVDGVLGIPLPPGLPVAADFLVRVQAVTIDPALPYLFRSTNEGFWRGGEPQTGIVVEAVGPSSYDRDPAAGFWRVRHLGGRLPIQTIWLDWWQCDEPGQQTMVFDIDQQLGERRHDGGNSTAPGCQGTYRNGSDVATGLDYTDPGNHRAPCAAQGESAGFAIELGSPEAAQVLVYRFTGGLFDTGAVFEFDCDTDGGLGVSGDAMRGLFVRVQLVDGSWLEGRLRRDPGQPLRAYVHL